MGVLLRCRLESLASSLFCPKGSVPQRKTVTLKIVTGQRWLFFSFLLSWVSVTHRGPREEASHPALPTGVPFAECEILLLIDTTFQYTFVFSIGLSYYALVPNSFNDGRFIIFLTNLARPTPHCYFLFFVAVFPFLFFQDKFK